MSDDRDLPSPDPAFHWRRESWGYSLRCEPLARWAEHLFTTRQLELRGADSSSNEWSQALAAVGATRDDLLRVKQIHGRTVRVVRQGSNRSAEVSVRPDADAIVSHDPGSVLAVQVADCVPLLMVDTQLGAVAAVHAGWRGTLAQIAAAAVETMTREFGTRPRDLVAAIGPSIGPCCYQVGREVTDAFAASGATEAQLARWFRHIDDDVRLDLWTVNRDQLVAAGVAPERIHVCGLCTRTHSHHFDSYRAHGPGAGRMAALIQTPAPSE
jgi:YfiH family protein